MVVVKLMKKMRPCCRRLFWRMRAYLKKAKFRSQKKQFKFQYDPSSYALNFDDGLYLNALKKYSDQDHAIANNNVTAAAIVPLPCAAAATVSSAYWVFILLVKSI